MRILTTKSQSAIVHRLIHGTFWSLVGSVISKCLVLLATAIITHVLTQGEYGRVGLIRTTIQMFTGLLGLGMGATAAKYIAQYRRDCFLEAFKMYLVSNIFAWSIGIVSCLLVVVGASWIAQYTLHDITLVSELRLGGLILLFCIINGAQQGVLSGFEDFKGIAIANFLMGVCEIIFVYWGARLGGVRGTIGAFGMVYFCVAFFYFCRIRKHISYSLDYMYKMICQLQKKDFRIIVTYSLPVALSSLVCVPALWWSKTFLTRQAGYEALAVFDIADQWRTQILFIPSTIAGVLLPIVSSSKQRNDSIKVLKYNLKINILVTVVLAGCVYVLRDLIMQIYGSAYCNSWPLFILALTAVLISVSNVLGTAFFAIGKPMKVLGWNMILGVSIILLSYVFVNRDSGENGLAYAHLFSYVVFVFLLSVFSYFRYKRL